MRLWISFAMTAALSTAAFAAGSRWASSYHQGTLEAVIDNGHGASLNIYCPSGQNDHTPGIFIEAVALKPKAGEKVDVQIAVDGKSNTFVFDEIQFTAANAAGLNGLNALIDALAKSRSATFTMSVPKFGVSETFSTAGGGESAEIRSLLSGRLPVKATRPAISS